MNAMPNPLSPYAFSGPHSMIEIAEARRLGRFVLVFERVDSTNDLAAAVADPACDGLAILADEQIAGRGQHGRTWLAPPRSSVLLSLAFFPPPLLRRPALLTAWAAVSVCKLVQEVVGLPARIKWPNDVFLRGRKVCGILIEQGRGTGAPGGWKGPGVLPATVVGIGLNVQQSAADLAAAGLLEATSLAQFTDTPLDTRVVAVRLLRRLDEEYDLLCGAKSPDGEELAALEACWKWHLGLLGRNVRVECSDGTYLGRLKDVGFQGIELQPPGAPPLVLSPERVQHLFAEEDEGTRINADSADFRGSEGKKC